MGFVSIVIGLVIAGLIGAALPRIPAQPLRTAAALVALIVVLAGVALSSLRFVPADRVGVVTQNLLGERMSPGQVIALDDQIGVQAGTLMPGWHFWLWPVIYDVDLVALTSVGKDQVALVEAKDGAPLSVGQVFADEIPTAQFGELVENPVRFLTDDAGQKGPQTSVLTPGLYRINTALFEVDLVGQTDVMAGTVAVLKSNVGGDPSIRIDTEADAGETFFLASDGEKGVRARVLPPGKHPINPKAFEVNIVSTERRVANYTAQREGADMTFGEIPVKSSDGFNFPVDVRVVYYIRQDDAPRVVALLGGDNQKLQQLLTSRVRSIFRDNAESVSALDYVNQRSTQAKTSARMLREAMAPYGITIESVDIGEVGSEATLGDLLQTQRDRKIATEQEQTFKVQQAAAEQEKELMRIRQEAEEEKRLATARYQVQIAEEEKRQRVIAAEADAEAIDIRAKAQAEAYRVIATQIGPTNAALMELMKIVGEQGVSITPRVMVIGDEGGSGDPQTAALIGTMLDRMVRPHDPGSAPARGPDRAEGAPRGE
jgi:uncharacterized membrane protein YqiK